MLSFVAPSFLYHPLLSFASRLSIIIILYYPLLHGLSIIILYYPLLSFIPVSCESILLTLLTHRVSKNVQFTVGSTVYVWFDDGAQSMAYFAKVLERDDVASTIVVQWYQDVDETGRTMKLLNKKSNFRLLLLLLFLFLSFSSSTFSFFSSSSFFLFSFFCP